MIHIKKSKKFERSGALTFGALESGSRGLGSRCGRAIEPYSFRRYTLLSLQCLSHPEIKIGTGKPSRKLKPSRMRVAIFLVASFYRKRDKLQLDGWLSSTAGFSFAYNITQTILKALTSETNGDTCVPSSHLSAIQKTLTHDRVTIVAAKFVLWSLYKTRPILFAAFYFRWQPRTICVKIFKDVFDKFYE